MQRDGKTVLVSSRSALDWTWRFPWIVESALKLPLTQFAIAGEICVLDARGVSDFDALHSNRHNEDAQLYAFDSVALDGDDLREEPRSSGRPPLRRCCGGGRRDRARAVSRGLRPRLEGPVSSTASAATGQSLVTGSK
ncbi:hypothetical protein [Bradyrhizobium elkanii]|uniref:hypothetical protein n=1 Tax=Bradyrhizobium elkanii TaxID=29448 RepID=UPI001AE87448|nr:hypothetical protein [Bradyrhizobium elkanii]MBP2427617.1 ATP-dependent DNA ligase [Bradyrhizobium elkanii]WLA94689.1 hypothetical protein QNJ96_16105 [Bradyrhizobium elkanii]